MAELTKEGGWQKACEDVVMMAPIIASFGVDQR